MASILHGLQPRIPYLGSHHLCSLARAAGLVSNKPPVDWLAAVAVAASDKMALMTNLAMCRLAHGLVCAGYKPGWGWMERWLLELFCRSGLLAVLSVC